MDSGYLPKSSYMVRERHFTRWCQWDDIRLGNPPPTDPNYNKYGGGYFLDYGEGASTEVPFFAFASKPGRMTTSVAAGPSAFNGALNFQVWTGSTNSTWDVGGNGSPNRNWAAPSGVYQLWPSANSTTSTWANGETAAYFPTATGTISIVDNTNYGTTNVVTTYGITTGTASNYTFTGTTPLVITGNFSNNTPVFWQQSDRWYHHQPLQWRDQRRRWHQYRHAAKPAPLR